MNTNEFVDVVRLDSFVAKANQEIVRAISYSPTLQTYMVRVDRRSVSYPMWRKKVDRTILNDNGCTVLPSWVVDNFGIRDKFGVGKNKEENQIPIFFNKKRYDGASITVQTESRATPFYTLAPLELLKNFELPSK